MDDVFKHVSRAVQAAMLRKGCLIAGPGAVGVCELPPPCACADELVFTAIAALEAAGWVMMPEEPTDEMIKKAVDTEGMRSVQSCIEISSIHSLPLPGHEISPIHQAYKAMLAARPQLTEKGE